MQKNIIIVVVLIIILGGLFFAFNKKSSAPVTPSSETSVTTPTQSSSPSQSPVSSKGPKDSFLAMKKEFDNIKTFADLDAYTRKYSSAAQVAKLDASKAQLDAMPAAQKDQLVALAMAVSPKSSSITTIQESVTGNTATLMVSTTNPKVTGTVNMVMENGQWKIEKEAWKQQ